MSTMRNFTVIYLFIIEILKFLKKLILDYEKKLELLYYSVYTY